MSGTDKGERPIIFDPKYRENPIAIAKYLNRVLSTADPVRISQAIGDMLRAQGVTRFAQKAGYRRDNLYRTFKGQRSPRLATVVDVLTWLDIQLIAKPRRPVGRRRKAKN